MIILCVINYRQLIGTCVVFQVENKFELDKYYIGYGIVFSIFFI